MAELHLSRDGAERYPGLCTQTEIADLERLLQPYAGGAGARIFENRPLAQWLNDSPIRNVVASVLGSGARPVRAILFDKSKHANWTVGWHQDRTVAVRERVDEPGFDHWTIKAGVQHVEPPFRLIENLLTARIHIDPVSEANSPLLIAPGSHRLGRIEESEIEGAIERCGTVACLADPGDVWLYRTAILHASEPSRAETPRRVLQVDFSSDDLPGGLKWCGVRSGPD